MSKRPTQQQMDRMAEIKLGPCMACIMRARKSWIPFEWVVHGCDAHHLTNESGMRRGHDETIALCQYHHRRVPMGGWPLDQLLDAYGPSLMDGSKVFRSAYGTDDELLALQEKYLEKANA